MLKEDVSKTDLAIGELSRLTGISAHTLRIWERRYGSPQSLRLPSGHRRYPREEVPRLRAVARALKAGHQPRKVVAANLKELESLLNLASFLPNGKQDSHRDATDTKLTSLPFIMDSWVEATHRYCNRTLDQGFFEEWSRRGPLNFVKDCAGPFLKQIGDGWETGELSVSQEHFASERLSDFLGSMWRRTQERNDGSFCVMTALPGENHQLGLQMCAVVAAVANRRVIYLGANTPYEEIISAVLKSNATLLCISVSQSYNAQTAQQYFQKLRDRLDASIEIVAGGRGCPQLPEGIRGIQNLEDFCNWLLKSGKHEDEE